MKMKSSSLRQKFWRPRLVAVLLLAASALGGEEKSTTITTTTTMTTTRATKMMMGNQIDASEASPLPLPSPPYSIAHRGASGLVPEHTMPAYQLAVEQGVDFIECDAIYTRDCALICRHDADLSLSSDAARVFPEKRRKAPVVIDGVSFADAVLASDLTLAEVRQLRARQAKADSLGRSRAFDGLFGLVTLDEFASYAASVAAAASASSSSSSAAADGRNSSSSSASSPPPRRSRPRVVGVHVEAKHPTWHSATLPRCARDPAAMVEGVAAVLRRHGFATLSSPSSSSPPPSPSSSSPSSSSSSSSDFARDPLWLRAPTFLQCFEPGALAEARRRGRVAAPMVQLVDDASAVVPGGWGNNNGRGRDGDGDKGGDKGNVTFADLLSDQGLKRVAEFAHAIGPSVAAVLDSSSSAAALAPRARRQGLALHAWTLRDDKINLEKFRERGGDGALDEARATFAVVEAAFGDFPATVVRAAEEERRGRIGKRVEE